MGEKMESEVDIAKQNKERLDKRRHRNLGFDASDTMLCIEHKQACQRFLDWFNEVIDIGNNLYLTPEKGYKVLIEIMIEKKKQLEKAIKVYDEKAD